MSAKGGKRTFILLTVDVWNALTAGIRGQPKCRRSAWRRVQRSKDSDIDPDIASLFK